MQGISVSGMTVVFVLLLARGVVVEVKHDSGDVEWGSRLDQSPHCVKPAPRCRICNQRLGI